MLHPCPEVCYKKQLDFHHRQPLQELGLHPNGRQESPWAYARERVFLILIDILGLVSKAQQTREESKYQVF